MNRTTFIDMMTQRITDVLGESKVNALILERGELVVQVLEELPVEGDIWNTEFAQALYEQMTYEKLMADVVEVNGVMFLKESTSEEDTRELIEDIRDRMQELPDDFRAVSIVGARLTQDLMAKAVAV